MLSLTATGEMSVAHEGFGQSQYGKENIKGVCFETQHLCFCLSLFSFIFFSKKSPNPFMWCQFEEDD